MHFWDPQPPADWIEEFKDHLTENTDHLSAEQFESGLEDGTVPTPNAFGLPAGKNTAGATCQEHISFKLCLI